ncbi:hypothetical protein DFJ73DRAFT_781125 [Zopfochytrium polystomum]|nr:hypothetical protein DFJ73DRAFT_781125 [Zopfochytrium polystomum]
MSSSSSSSASTGIIEVVKRKPTAASSHHQQYSASSSGSIGAAIVGDDPEADRIEAKLNAVPKVEPLLKTSLEAPGFSWGSFFSGPTRRKETPFDASGQPLDALMNRIRFHTNTCAQTVAEDQKLLGERINALDEYTAKLVGTVSTHVQQSRQNVDVLSKMAVIRKHAESTKTYLLDIRTTLESLNQFLDPGERLEHPENARRYPKSYKFLRAAHTPSATPVQSP